MRGDENFIQFLVDNTVENRKFERPRRRWNRFLTEVRYKKCEMDSADKDIIQWSIPVNTVMNLRIS